MCKCNMSILKVDLFTKVAHYSIIILNICNNEKYYQIYIFVNTSCHLLIKSLVKS